MPILYDKPEQLLDNAKELMVHLQSTAQHTLSENDALNIIASMFGWGSWSEMHYATQKHVSTHKQWDCMTWREKVTHIISQAPGSASLLRKKSTSTSGDNLDSSQLYAVQEWLMATFMPSLEPIGHKERRSAWFPWLRAEQKASYRDISSERAFEGIKLLCDDTQKISAHLGNRFLPAMNDPDCIVFCEEALAIDFARCFSERGHEIVLFSNGFSLPDSIPYTKAIWFPDQKAGEDNPYSLYAYVKNYPHMLPPLSLALAYVAIDRSIASSAGEHASMFFTLPTIAECEYIIRSKTEPTLKAHAERVMSSFLTYMPQGDDTTCSALGKLDEARWHHATYGAKQLLEKMSSRLNTSINNAIPIHEFNRGVQKTLYLCATNKSEGDLIHMKVMFNMLLHRLSELPPCMKAHPWLILAPAITTSFPREVKACNFTPAPTKRQNLAFSFVASVRSQASR